MTAPLIAIPTYHFGPGQVGNWEGAYALPEPYVAALVAAGAQVALLPPSPAADPEALLAAVDGLLLAGGGDIEPARYGAADHPHQYGVDPDRDELELKLARAAVRLGTPTLGIQHLPDVDGLVEHRNGAMQALHDLRVEPGSRLAEALGRGEAEGLSHHHQSLDRLGDGFRPVAWAPDGLVEGIERDQGWTVGVLWHPEITARADPVQQRLLRSFVEVASRRGQAFWRRRAEPVGFGGPGATTG